MVTVRIFVNNTEAWLARSMLASEGINAIVADDHINTLYAPIALGARLQVDEADLERAREVLDKHEGFTPLTDDFVPVPDDGATENEPPPYEPSPIVQNWGHMAFGTLIGIAFFGAIFWWLIPLNWKHGTAELVQMGIEAKQKKNYAAALKYYDAALAGRPGDPIVHYDRGLAYFDKQEYAKAIEDFSASISSRPGHSESYSMLIQSYVATRQFDKAMEQANKLIALGSYSGKAYRLRASVYEGLQQWVDAKNDLNEAIGLDSSDFRAYGSRAYVNYKTSDFDAAMADADMALKIDNTSAGPHEYRAFVFAAKENYPQALDEMKIARECAPESSNVMVSFGFVYIRMDETDKALDALNQAITIDQSGPVAYEDRAIVWARKGDAQKALADFTRAIELAPDKWQVYSALAWFYATSPVPGARDGAKAKELATKACELSHWKHGECIDTLAAAEAELGDFPAAVNHATQAIALVKDDKTISSEDRGIMADALKAYQQGQPYRDTRK